MAFTFIVLIKDRLFSLSCPVHVHFLSCTSVRIVLYKKEFGAVVAGLHRQRIIKAFCLKENTKVPFTLYNLLFTDKFRSSIDLWLQSVACANIVQKSFKISVIKIRYLQKCFPFSLEWFYKSATKISSLYSKNTPAALCFEVGMCVPFSPHTEMIRLMLLGTDTADHLGVYLVALNRWIL